MQSVTCKNNNVAHLHFLIISTDPYLYFISGLYLNNHVKYFNDTLESYTTVQYGVLNARMTTPLRLLIISPDPYFQFMSGL